LGASRGDPRGIESGHPDHRRGHPQRPTLPNELAAALDNARDNPDWTQLVDTIRHIHTSHPNHEPLPHDLDETDTWIIEQLVAAVLAERSVADLEAAWGLFLDDVVQSIRSGQPLGDDARDILDELFGNPDWTQLADTIRHIHATFPDHEPLPYDDLDEVDTWVIAELLTRLSTTTNS